MLFLLKKESIKKYAKKSLLILLTCCSMVLGAQSNSFDQALSSESYINWKDGAFISTVNLDVDMANIVLPSGRNIATNRMEQKLPLLIKNPLLTVTINSSTQIGDAVLWNLLSIGNITETIEEGKVTPTVFSRSGDSLTTNHTITLQDLSSLLIKHTTPYTPNIPIDRISSRSYTGIIIDARGTLPVQGEFTHERANAALFPKVWDEEMNLLYEVNMVEPKVVRDSGLVQYASATTDSTFSQRVGADPLRIRARGVFGIHRTDPLISKNDALRILSIPENIDLLMQGKVIILLDEESLVHQVKAPSKDESYFYMVQEVSNFIFENVIEDLEVIDTDRGMLIPLRDLKFIPDSAELLPEEGDRLDILARSLIIATENNESTILVEGHTASVGRPIGEQNLSVERAISIIDELVERGVPEELFTFRGYGGEIPIGDNSTEEGRALNRRVEITVVPRQTYVQRIY